MSRLKTSLGQYSDSPVQYSGKSHSPFLDLHKVPVIKIKKNKIYQVTVIFFCNNQLPALFGRHVFKSQHSPVAHDAFACNMHVYGSQHEFLQNSGSPQSHCSPGSTKPLPHCGESNNFAGLFL